MKKIVLSIILLITMLTAIPVNAANYDFRELIPVDIETTVVGDKFSYQGIYYNTGNKEGADKTKKDYIIFRKIANISDEAKPLSMSIALFGEDKKNIGTIHICDKTLQPKEGIPYEIEVTPEYLGIKEQKTKIKYKTKEIKYIAIIDQNLTCRNKTGADEYIGQTVQEIGYKRNNQFDTASKTTFTIYIVIGAVLLGLFLYAFMFTNQYKNMDGEDVRQGYAYKNEELREEIEKELNRNPPKPPEPKKIKTDEVLQQEQQEAEADKSNTDLHNMFK